MIELKITGNSPMEVMVQTCAFSSHMLMDKYVLDATDAYMKADAAQYGANAPTVTPGPTYDQPTPQQILQAINENTKETPATIPEKPVKAAKKAGTPVVEKKAVPAQPVDPTPAAITEDLPVSTPVPSVEDVRAKMKSIPKEKRAAVKELLTKYGVDNVGKIPEESRVAFLADVEEVLKDA